MTDFASMGEEEQLSALEAALIGDAGTPEKPEAAAAEGDTAPVETDPQEDEAEVEPAETPTIAPPHSWSKEDREVFTQLPPEAQEILTRRENERDAAVRRGQNEAAETRKERDLLVQERAFLAQQLAPAISNLTNTIQADYSPQRMQELAATDPGAWAKAMAEREGRIQQLNMLQAEQGRTADLMRQTEAEKLFEAMPEWRDPATFRAAATKHREVGEFLGFSRAEIDSTLDHRALRTLELARIGKEYLDAQKAPARKVAPPIPPRVIAPRQRTDSTATDNRSRNELIRIARSGTQDEQLAALANLL